MKRTLMLPTLVFTLLTSSHALAWSQNERVSGYTRKDGTYVEPHNRTKANDRYSDNYSSQDNVNPYTGKQGSVSYDSYHERKSRRQGGNGYGADY